MKMILLSLVSVALASCTFATRLETRVDGSRQTEILAKVGGKSHYDGSRGGGMVVTTDDEASFKTAAGSALSYGIGLAAAKAWSGVENAKQVTQRAATASKAGVDAARINATKETVLGLGGNPEANPAVIKVAGEVFQ